MTCRLVQSFSRHLRRLSVHALAVRTCCTPTCTYAILGLTGSFYPCLDRFGSESNVFRYLSTFYVGSLYPSLDTSRDRPYTRLLYAPAQLPVRKYFTITYLSICICYARLDSFNALPRPLSSHHQIGVQMLTCRIVDAARVIPDSCTFVQFTWFLSLHGVGSVGNLTLYRVSCLLAHCLQGRFVAGINLIGRNRRLNMYLVNFCGGVQLTANERLIHLLEHCLQGRFVAVINRVGRNRRLNIKMLLFLT